MVNDEVKISITVTLIPNGEAWKSGLTQTTKHLQLPIDALDLDTLTNYIHTLFEEIRHGLQDAGSKDR